MSETSERELRERIEASRTRMAETVEEIGVRVNPDRVQRQIKARARGEVDQFKANAKEKVRSTMRDLEHEVEDRGRSVWRAVKENPVPATLVGVGLAWMAANGMRSDDDRGLRRSGAYGGIEPRSPGFTGYSTAHAYAYEPRHPATGRAAEGRGYADYEGAPPAETIVRYEAESEGEEEGVRERAEAMGDELRHRGARAAGQAQEKAEDVADSTREKAAELADRGREQAREVRHRASEWGDRVEHRAKRTERRVEHAVHENPLAAGAIAAALGFAAGLMAPETRREHEVMGPTRDRMLDRARESAMETAGQAREKAKDRAGDAARRAVDEAFPGSGESGDGHEGERAMTEPGRS